MEREEVHLAESRRYHVLDSDHSVTDSRTKKNYSNQYEPGHLECKVAQDNERGETKAAIGYGLQLVACMESE